MHPSSASPRGGRRVGSVTYAHSPYVYRTTVEEAPVSPMSDHGRPDPSSLSNYHSPRSLSQSASNVDNNSLGGQNRNVNGGSLHEFNSQPNSPLGRSNSGQEYSQPIQVGSAPNVLPRYRRSMQSPMTRAGNESGSRGGFPSSPSGSLPPRSPFKAREDSTSAFSGGESAPVRGPNNPYRMPAATTGMSAPQYAMPLSSSYRGGGGGSGRQSPAPPHTRQSSNGGGVGGLASPSFSAPPTSPPNATAGPAPAYGSGAANNSSNAFHQRSNSGISSNNNTSSYAPTGFSMPPAMATAGNAGSFHGPPSGRAGSHSNSYVDPRSSHPSSPLLSSTGRPPMGNSVNARGEPISPTHMYNNNSNNNGAPPPTFATALQQQQQQQGSGSGFGVGSFPGRRATTAAAASGHLSSPFSNHMTVPLGGTDPSAMSESYGTNTKTLSTMADDTMSSSGKSGSSASSIRDDLPLCPNDDACTAINDRKHQKKYAHTCRLFPCYHGHVVRHAKLFRHVPGQISLPEGMTAGAKVSSHALASVNFSTISPEAPNAYRIYVSHGDKSYEIFGDWASVKVHTFKRYLHQVYHIPPGSQVLSVMKTGKVMDDDINTVKCYGIEEDSVIQLRSDIEDASGPGKLRIPLDDL